MQQFYSVEQIESFRDLVVSAVAAERHACDARGLWRSLVDGGSAIAIAFHSADWSYLVVAQGNQHAPLSPRSQAALECALRGKSHKALAIELGVSPSTVAAALKLGLATLGLGGLPSRVPLSLVALVHAATEGDAAARRLTSTDVFAHGRRYEVVCAPRPRLGALFSPAVAEVVMMHTEGKSYAEIAAHRSTSTRTVANQIASAFQRLRVSGRSDLMSHFMRHSA
jgi:DNA-binding CsgD family transcriptional regulator